jgi:hypothetical protein
MKDTLLIGIGKRINVSPAVTIVLGTGPGATLIDGVEKNSTTGDSAYFRCSTAPTILPQVPCYLVSRHASSGS